MGNDILTTPDTGGKSDRTDDTSEKNWFDSQEQFHVNMKLKNASNFFIYMKSKKWTNIL